VIDTSFPDISRNTTQYIINSECSGKFVKLFGNIPFVSVGYEESGKQISKLESFDVAQYGDAVDSALELSNPNKLRL
jgi:hypothetical protein